MILKPSRQRCQHGSAPGRSLPGALLLLLLTCLGATLGEIREATAQSDGISPPADSLRTDTLKSPQADTLRARTGADTLAASVDRSGLDTVVTYSARDSIVMDLRGRRIRLYGDAELINGAQQLHAYYIEVDFETSELYAESFYDSAAERHSEIPVFRDGSEEFTATRLSYNFKTRKGTLAAAETRFEDGFYYGEKVKRVSENVLFIKDGVYTTCNAPHPHYYFASPEMKAVVGDRVFADQPTLYVSDVPILYLPLGVFFPSKGGGKQSGLIFPKFEPSSAFGFTVKDIGYFWAGNDYVDAQLLASLFSKGGFTTDGRFRFRYKGFVDVQQSDLYLSYGQTRQNPDAPFEISRQLRYNGSIQLDRRTRIGGNLSFATRNAIRQTTTTTDYFNRYQDITTQELTSDFSFNTGWDWGSLSASYSRNYNIVTGEVPREVFPAVSFSIPTISPFSSSGGEETFWDKLSPSFGGTISAQRIYSLTDTLPGGGYKNEREQRGAQITPSFSLSPKLGPITVQPSINYQAGIFGRRIVKEPSANGLGIDTSYINGLYYAHSYGFSLGFSTTLYGLAQPRIWGLNALRHVLTPRISLSYRPDFGDNAFGYYDEFFNPLTNQVERYSIFEADRGAASVPSAGLQQLIGISLGNRFEAKIAQGDTVEDKKLELLSLNLNTSYNMAAAEFKWSDIILSAGTDLGTVGSLSANATFTPYAADTAGMKIPELLLDRNEGLLRATRAGLTVRTRINDEGFNTDPFSTYALDSADARRGRFDFDHIPFDEQAFYGERVRGAKDFGIPWEIGLTASYSLYQVGNSFKSSFSLNTDLSLSLTPTTRIGGNTLYDLEAGEFRVPTISVYKDIHCWEMSFNWSPQNGYFSFRLNIKAPQLQDLELKKTGP